MNTYLYIAIVVVSVFMINFLAMSTGVDLGIEKMEKQAIAQGFGTYDENAKFIWNDRCEQ